MNADDAYRADALQTLEKDVADLLASLRKRDGVAAIAAYSLLQESVQRILDHDAPNGRHHCGRPLDEDGECPAWCDQ